MTKIDQRNRLDDEVFTFRATKNGKVFLFWQGKQVTVLKGKAAQQFKNKMKGCNHKEAQLIMAKATGHFKHGNERRGT